MLANVTCPACQHRYWLDEGQMLSRQICPKCQAAFFAGKSTAEAKAGAAGATPAASAQPSYSKTMIGEAAPPIKYNCPRCKAPLEAEGIEGGTKKNCPNCTQRHQVPAAAAKPEAAAPAPALNKTMLAGDESAVPPAPPIKYNCPNCKKPLEAPVSQAGTKQNCPSCNQRLQVPAAPPGAPNRNKTMLAGDESAGPASAAQGAPSANGARGSVPVPGAAPAPTNPWAQYGTPKNVAIGIVLLLLLLLIVPAVIRGGKSVDAEALARAMERMEKLEKDMADKNREREQHAKEEAEARRRYDDEMRQRRDEDERKRAENKRALEREEDEDRKVALRKKQRLEDEEEKKARQRRDEEYERKLVEARAKTEKAEKDLAAQKQERQNTQTIIQQPPVIYHPYYHPRYYWPW